MSVPGDTGSGPGGRQETTSGAPAYAGPPPWPPASPGYAPPFGYQSAPGHLPPPGPGAFWPSQAANPRRFGGSLARWWWLTSVAAMLTVGLLVAVIVYQPAHPGGGTVAASALPDVLLSAEEAAHAVGAESLSGEPVQDKLADTPIVDEDCVGVLKAAEQKAYGKAGWTAVRTQELGDAPAKGWRLIQAVVSFPDAESANNFVGNAATDWQRCANRELNTRNVNKDDPRNVFWSTGSASRAGGVLAMDMIQEAQGWNCQRALSTRNNVVIDLDLCGRSVAGSAVPQFVNAVDKKIDARAS
ncbi:sensor domain-containing protein [Mycobacterium sp. E342]|uniref:sensor domain-containing protein n=1 Tax=Mycobacterium sp. E342 TaxID=1834147 RepID=UPI0009ECD9E4|nr:sensor domain-containing protein [Mycobacterium sp. E342]